MKYFNLLLFILLLSMAELSFGQSTQVDSLKAILDKTLSDWMGGNSQMDDILVMGVRV
jgi:hypothetical protein